MIVQNITEKEVNTRFGAKPVYSVTVEGESYGYGFKRPSFKVGDDIEFTSSEGKYGKDMDVSSVRVIASGVGPTTPTAIPAPARFVPTSARPFPIPALHGDRAIVRQNALTNARELVGILLGEYLKETAPDAGRAFPLYDWADTTIKLARKFEAYSCGDLDMEEAMKGVE